MRIEYHRTLIADRARNRAFRDALAAVIRKGETDVADIGAGTGLMGLIAARLGARRVYLYEAAEVVGVAAAVLKANRVRNAEILPCHSTEMVDPPRVDVVVTETLGNYALEEDIIETASDAVARFLIPGGTLIPAAITQWVAPVTSGRFAQELQAWRTVGTDLGLAIDLSTPAAMSANNVYVRTVRADELLAAAAIEAEAGGGARGSGSGVASARVWDRIDLMRRPSAKRSGDARWRITSPTSIHGFAVWWVAELVPGVVLSTAPDAPVTHWEQLYFPLASPLSVATGETLAVRLSSRSSRETGTTLTWTAMRQDSDGRTLEKRAHDLDKGYLP